ncbi:DUF1378 family protein [Escherichia coli]|nr:DUF1378 family protein [Escherichia coli]
MSAGQSAGSKPEEPLI